MGCTGIKRLTDSLGKLRSLLELNISSTQLIELPDAIFGGLEELKVIKMESCGVRKLPRSIGMMKKLEELHANHSSLEGNIPSEIGMLSCLRILELSGTKISSLPFTTNQLSSLQKLNLSRCDALVALPRLPTSLVSLKFSSSGEPLDMVPDLSNLNDLEYLKLCIDVKEIFFGKKGPATGKKSSQSESPDVSRRMTLEWAMSRRTNWIKDLHKLEYLVLRVGNVPSLSPLLGNLSQLKALALGCQGLRRIPQLPSNLLYLHLGGLAMNVMLPCLSNLKQLEELRFLQCEIGEDGFGSLGVGELEILEHLEVQEDFSELNGLHLPVSLKRLYVTGCMHVNKLPDVSHLRNLQMLCLKDCKELAEIPGLEQLDPLPKISITSCEKLKIGVSTSF